MNLLVTGAGGFLGRHVVQAALSRGHHVRAMVRPAAETGGLGWEQSALLDIARADLREPGGVRRALDQVDCVIHLAAVKSGGFYEQLRGTVVATENLLEAMIEQHVERLVAVSTFSVYDYLGLRSHSRLDERSPVETRPERREHYAQSKLLQERLIGEYADRHGLRTTIVRPGVIYGRDHCWTDQLGIRCGRRVWLRFGGRGQLRLTYVENCADAIVLAAASEASVGEVLNLVDDDLPSRRRYARELRRRVSRRPMVLWVPAPAVRLAATLAGLTNGALFRGRARLPWFLVPAKLHAQVKPLCYGNEHVRAVTGWSPRYSLMEALDRSFADA